MIIAIDGPSGSGKSTISKLVAKELSLIYIDTGAIYRTLAYVAGQEKVSLDDGRSLGKLATNFQISFKNESSINKVFYKNEEVTDKIRTPEISMSASKVSAHVEVRDALLGIQRSLGRASNSILEGRDIGTVVFPDADYKFFLIATDDVRAMRRYKELTAKNISISFEEVKKQVIQRDKQDSSRDIAPLKAASDAINIDSSNMSIPEVVAFIVSTVKKA